MRHAADRIRHGIQHVAHEVHFQTIVLPPFESSRIVTTLRSTTARAMLTWAHSRFRQMVKTVADETFTTIDEPSEAYTSKTCSAYGHIQQIHAQEAWTCASCGVMHDRDINGARGIFLKSLALGDTPSRCLAACA